MSQIMQWVWPLQEARPSLYFDYAATTPVDERVIAKMVECLGREGSFGNPASHGHAFGQQARAQVEKARTQVASLVGTQPQRLVWTSGATESNNLALKGVALRRDRGHIISSQLEHKAVLDTLQQLEAEGFEVTYLPPDKRGAITLDAVRQALRSDTFLVSLMLVNNELGTITDIARIGQLVRASGALFHVDAAQATGKVDIHLDALAVDLMSFSAHKTYGPKGIGALYVGERACDQLAAQIHGGGHEGGLRSGTLATHQIVGMGEAFAIALAASSAETARIAALRDRLIGALRGLPLVINADQTGRIPHTLSLTPDRDIALGSSLAVSSTSACNSASNAPSHVLLALGLRPAEALRSIRVSLGRFTTDEEIDAAADEIRRAILLPIP